MRNFQVYDIISAINSSSILSHNSFRYKDNHLIVSKLPYPIINSTIIVFSRILHLILHKSKNKYYCDNLHIGLLITFADGLCGISNGESSSESNNYTNNGRWFS